MYSNAVSPMQPQAMYIYLLAFLYNSYTYFAYGEWHKDK